MISAAGWTGALIKEIDSRVRQLNEPESTGLQAETFKPERINRMSNRHHRKNKPMPSIEGERIFPNEESRKIQLEIDLIRLQMRQLQVRLDNKDVTPLAFFYEMQNLKFEIFKVERRVSKLSKELAWVTKI